MLNALSFQIVSLLLGTQFTLYVNYYTENSTKLLKGAFFLYQWILRHSFILVLRLFCLSSTSTYILHYFQFSSRHLSKPNRRKWFHQSAPSSSPGTKADLIQSFRPSTKLVTRRRCEQRHVTWMENSGGRMKRRESGAQRGWRSCFQLSCPPTQQHHHHQQLFKHSFIMSPWRMRQ